MLFELISASELISLMKLELRSSTFSSGAYNFLKGLIAVILLFQSQSSSSWGMKNDPIFSIELMLLPPSVIDLSCLSSLFDTISTIVAI